MNEPAVETAKGVKPSMPWPAYTVEKWDVARLKPFELNARTHSEKQIKELRASLREFGWTMPILSREDGTIIAGHGRLEAAIAEGYMDVPVVVATGWTEIQCRAYTLADNKLSLNSGWDDFKLGTELNLLSTAGVDLHLLGFTDKEQKKFLPTSGTGGLAGGVNLDSAFQVLIECKDEADQIRILKHLSETGIKCRALIA